MAFIAAGLKDVVRVAQGSSDSLEWLQVEGEQGVGLVPANGSGSNLGRVSAYEGGWSQSVAAAPVPVPVPVPAPPPPAPAPAPAVPQRSAEQWAWMRAVWNAHAASDPYRLFQQMSEHRWSAADLAQLTGNSEQAMGDYLTRIGAPAGFGGGVTLGRAAVSSDYVASIGPMPALPDAARPWWVATHAGADEDGNVRWHIELDLMAYTNWYVSQNTEGARNFARVHGSAASDGAGGVHFTTSGARMMAGAIEESGHQLAPSWVWHRDSRIDAYLNYQRMDDLQRAAMAQMLDTAQNREIMRLYDTGVSLPDNDVGESMRALYGSDLASSMLRLTQATDAMKSRYMRSLNEAMQRPPAVMLSPNWFDESGTVLQTYVREAGVDTATGLPPGWVYGASRYDEDGLPIQTFEFSATAYHNWYIRQDDPFKRVMGMAYGEAVANGRDGGYRTQGTLEQLSISLEHHDETGAPMRADDVTLSLSSGLTKINPSNPPGLNDAGMVFFMPSIGFVTANGNVKKKKKSFMMRAVPLVMMAAVAYMSAGTLGPAAAGAMGMTTVTATGAVALTAAGAMASAAVAGAMTSLVSGLLNDNLTFEGILKGALTSALSAGLLRGVEALSGTPIGEMGKVGMIATRTTVQGAVQALMGGSFKDGAIAGFASGLGQAMTTGMNERIAQALKDGTMSAAEAAQARFFASMVGASVRIVASGADEPGYALASAFMEEVLGQVAPPDPSLPVSKFIPDAGDEGTAPQVEATPLAPAEFIAVEELPPVPDPEPSPGAEPELDLFDPQWGSEAIDALALLGQGIGLGMPELDWNEDKEAEARVSRRVVERGDTLTKIAAGDYAKLAAIYAVNTIKLDPRTGSPVLKVGDSLVIPSLSHLSAEQHGQFERAGRELTVYNQSRRDELAALALQAQRQAAHVANSDERELRRGWMNERPMLRQEAGLFSGETLATSLFPNGQTNGLSSGLFPSTIGSPVPGSFNAGLNDDPPSAPASSVKQRDDMGILETLGSSLERGILALKALPATLQLVNQSAGLNQLDYVDRTLAAGGQVDFKQLGVMGEAYARLKTSEERANFRATFGSAMQAKAAESAVDMVTLHKERNAIPLPSVVDRTMAAKGWGEAFSAIKSDPLRFVAAVGPESLVQSVPGLVAAVPAGMALGPAGPSLTIGANSFLVDYGSSLTEMMQEAGVDTTNPEALKAALRDPNVLATVIQRAGAHAGVVGAVDAVSGGLAGKVLLPKAVTTQLATRPVLQELANVALQVPVQGALGAAAEAGGEWAAGQELKPGAILGEFFGETFGAPVEVTMALGARVKSDSHPYGPGGAPTTDSASFPQDSMPAAAPGSAEPVTSSSGTTPTPAPVVGPEEQGPSVVSATPPSVEVPLNWTRIRTESDGSVLALQEQTAAPAAPPTYDAETTAQIEATRARILAEPNQVLIRGVRGTFDEGPRSGQYTGNSWWRAVPIELEPILEGIRSGNLGPSADMALTRYTRMYWGENTGEVWVTTSHDLARGNPVTGRGFDGQINMAEPDIPLANVHQFRVERFRPAEPAGQTASTPEPVPAPFPVPDDIVPVELDLDMFGPAPESHGLAAGNGPGTDSSVGAMGPAAGNGAFKVTVSEASLQAHAGLGGFENAVVTRIPVADFLRLTTPHEAYLDKIRAQADGLGEFDAGKFNDNKLPTLTITSGMGDLAWLDASDGLPFLREEVAFRVVGHEGRHRAVLAGRAGSIDIPVLLVSPDGQPLPVTPAQGDLLLAQMFMGNLQYRGTYALGRMAPLAGDAGHVLAVANGVDTGPTVDPSR